MRTNLGTSPTDHALAPDSPPEQAATTTGSTAPTLQDYRARYEKLCKEFLVQKQMLVPVLQKAIPEFRKLSPDKIFASLSAPLIDTIPLHQEDFIASICPPGTATFSIFFEAKSPKLKFINNGLMIDIEVRNSFDDENNDDYVHAVMRGMYYSSRLFCTQKTTTLSTWTDRIFNKVKSAHTIWIFLNPSPARRNFASIFEGCEEVDIPPYPSPDKAKTAPQEKFELLPGLEYSRWSFIGLGGPVNKKYKDLYELQHVVFVADYTVEQKCDILEHKFGFTLTPELTQGLQNMFEFSQKIVAESLSQGRKEILEQLKAIKEQIRSGQSLDEAMQAFNIPESEQSSFRELLS